MYLLINSMQRNICQRVHLGSYDETLRLKIWTYLLNVGKIDFFHILYPNLGKD